MHSGVDQTSTDPTSGAERYAYDYATPWPRSCAVVAGIGLGLLGIALRGRLGPWPVAIAAVVALLVIGMTEMALRAAEKREVIVDSEHRQVVIRNFIYPVRFWDIKPKPEVVISFDEIRSVERHTWRGNTMWYIHTAQSRFVIHDYLTRSGQLADVLDRIASGTPPLSITRNMWVISFAGGFVGLGVVALLGWLLGLISFF